MFDSFFFHHSISERSEKTVLYGPESHRQFEIIYLAKGEVKYFIEGEEYLAKPGDMIFVPPNEIHSLQISGSSSYERIVVLFDFDLIKNMLAVGDIPIDDTCTRTHSYRVIPAEVIKKSRLKEIMFSIAEQKNDGENRSMRFFSLVLTLIAEINALLSDSTGKPMLPITKEQTVKAAIDYVNAHITLPLTLDRISSELYISKSTLCHKFSSYMNISLNRYIAIKKIYYAADLIKNGMSATEASLAVGYDHYTTFFYNYKKIMGVTPVEHKRD
jgi:AraC-like DNA-binding protein/uncharacterized cupin superfamily protein